jgi:hypothetical protein
VLSASRDEYAWLELLNEYNDGCAPHPDGHSLCRWGTHSLDDLTRDLRCLACPVRDVAET